MINRDDHFPPVFTDIDDANREIDKLRVMLVDANAKRAKAVEKAMLDKHSLTMSVKTLRERVALAEAAGGNVATTFDSLIDHFKKSKFVWWPLNGKDGLVAELERLRDQQDTK